MQVNSISSYDVRGFKKQTLNNKPVQNNNVAFAGEEDANRNNNMMKAMRNAGIAMMFLVPASSTISSCSTEDYGYVRAEANAWAGIGHYVDSTKCTHPSDTIIKWWYAWDRPIPLDTLYNNMQNWDIDGTDGDKNDSLSARNIIHYEGTREWEYGTREIGDMNVLESSKNILVYDTEIKDYKGNHEAFGKRVFRVPSGNFTIKKEDGTVLHSPKGLFVEEYENEFGDKNGSIFDCKLKSRAFIQTNGDTLNVAKRKGSTDFEETGKVAKGYLGANSILLHNLIGQYSTDDHYVDFKVDAINDKELRAKYVYAMDKKED